MLSLTSISKFQESLASQQKFKMQKAGILIEKKGWNISNFSLSKVILSRVAICLVLKTQGVCNPYPKAWI